MNNRTILYLEGFSRYKTFILEAAIEENKLNSLFNNSTDLTSLFTLANENQLRYFFYKIQADLPDSNVGQNIKKLIDFTKSKTYTGSVNEFRNLLANAYGVNINATNTPLLLKIYNALQKPADLTQPAPAPLQNFGSPPSTSTTTPSLCPSPAPSGPATAVPSAPGGGPGLPPAGPGTPTNGPASSIQARGEQLKQASTFRQGARSTSPISPKGGPTYYIRTSPGRYRPAVQADMDANIPLYMKNPNPLAAVVTPYVRVSDEVKKARRAGPVDQDAVDREMRAQGARRAQSFGPGGKRIEADGSIRRNSKLGGVAGSLSNFFGDVGNTLTGR